MTNKNIKAETLRIALQDLERNFKVIEAAVPADKYKWFQKIVIWIELDNSAVLPRTGAFLAAGGPAYVPSTGDPKFLPAKNRAIELSATHCLLDPWSEWRKKAVPYWLLHELAHAYHDQVLGFENREIEGAYKAALDAKLYDKVECKYYLPSGEVENRHVEGYAKTNKYEYFADLSVMYMGRNWYHPYDRDALRKHDPKGFAFMSKVWSPSK